MVHKKIEEMTGMPHAHHTKGSPFEHDPHEAGRAREALKEVEKEAGMTGKKPKSLY